MLYFEDDAITAKATAKVLRKSGFDVTHLNPNAFNTPGTPIGGEGSHFRQALKVFGRDAFDYVLTDHDMNVCEGHEVLALVREVGITAAAVSLSGNEGNIEAQYHERDRMVFLAKPATPQDLLDAFVRLDGKTGTQATVAVESSPGPWGSALSAGSPGALGGAVQASAVGVDAGGRAAGGGREASTFAPQVEAGPSETS